MTETGMALLEQVVIGGDLSRLAPADRLTYYKAVCESVGLNPLTRPLEYLHLSGKLVLYARKDATDQLRKKHGVSIMPPKCEVVEGLYIVTVCAKDKDGREDSEVGAVSIENLRGEARSNAIMKAVTKAKRRVTLSICGLGMLDETEVESVPGARPVAVDPITGELPTSNGHSDPSADAASAEVDDRDILLGRINGVFDKRRLNAGDRAKWWDKHCHGLDPRTADVSVLADLYAALKAKYGD